MILEKPHFFKFIIDHIDFYFLGSVYLSNGEIQPARDHERCPLPPVCSGNRLGIDFCCAVPHTDILYLQIIENARQYNGAVTGYYKAQFGVGTE